MIDKIFLLVIFFIVTRDSVADICLCAVKTKTQAGMNTQMYTINLSRCGYSLYFVEKKGITNTNVAAKTTGMDATLLELITKRRKASANKSRKLLRRLNLSR